MSATPDDTLTDPEQLIADLQRQLAECRAERDEALQRETATAEVLQVINSSPGDLINGFYAAVKRQRDGAGPDFRPTLRVMTHVEHLIAEVHAAGGTIRQHGDKNRAGSASTAARRSRRPHSRGQAPALLTILAEADVAPREWTRCFARLHPDRPPGDVRYGAGANSSPTPAGSSIVPGTICTRF
jgi:hypothetical protein